MSRDSSLYLKDIQLSCQKVLRYSEGLSKQELIADEKGYDAILRNLEIIGEAAKNLDLQTKTAIPEIDWRKISGFSDILAHVYFGIDIEILWDIIQNKIPQLLSAVTNYQSR